MARRLQSMDELFKGRHFEREVIVLCGRWYLRYKLSLRDLVEMMAERGLTLAHTTIMRWPAKMSGAVQEPTLRRESGSVARLSTPKVKPLLSPQAVHDSVHNPLRISRKPHPDWPSLRCSSNEHREYFFVPRPESLLATVQRIFAGFPIGPSR